LPISKNKLQILFIIATIMGIFGLFIFVQTNLPVFLLTSIPNLGLAAFFWYKYSKKSKYIASKKGKKS